VRDVLIDLIVAREPTSRARMARLRARLSLNALPGQQLLRLRARPRTPLLTRLGRILRGRLRTRARVLARLLLQSSQPILVLLHPRREIEDELHAHIPAAS
jgi:hypothetical protein